MSAFQAVSFFRTSFRIKSSTGKKNMFIGRNVIFLFYFVIPLFLDMPNDDALNQVLIFRSLDQEISSRSFDKGIGATIP